MRKNILRGLLLAALLPPLALLCVSCDDMEVDEVLTAGRLTGTLCSGTFSVKNTTVDPDAMAWYFTAQVGNFTVTTTKDGAVVTTEDLTGASAWWSGGPSSTAAVCKDGGKLVISAKYTEAGYGCGPFFEGNDGATYMSINPLSDAWIGGTILGTQDLGFDSLGDPVVGDTIEMTIDREGTEFYISVENKG